MPKFLERFLEYLRSDKFFRLILVIFFVESIWIALSAAYPQAFDENFHFGLIQVYSHYWLPFLSHQPAHADAYGAVARDPSYLYHYLMSFPYRFINIFIHKQITQVVLLRFINIALFGWGLILFRKVLARVGTSKASTNLILMLFILIPVVPQLAGQINYDNLLLPLIALMILYSYKLIDRIKANNLSIKDISFFVGAGLLTSLVKYAFLPIFAAMVLFLFVLIVRANKGKFRQFFNQLSVSWKKTSILLKILVVISLIIPIAMFAQRDLYNLARYHAIEPDCSKVLSVKECMSYSPWAYNYRNHSDIIAKGKTVSLPGTLAYPFQWLYWMWYRLFFAINGPAYRFTNYPPLPLPSLATLILLLIGLFALFKWWRKLFHGNIKLLLLFIVSATYIAALFGQGYYTYRYTLVLENMNGRYLLPVLLLLAAIFGQAIALALVKENRRKAIIALMALILFAEGGGAITFIARSDSTWDVQNKAVVKVNNVARKVIKKVVVHGGKSYSTRLWFFN